VENLCGEDLDKRNDSDWINVEVNRLRVESWRAVSKLYFEKRKVATTTKEDCLHSEALDSSQLH
jgi:hypothetical protein